MKRVLKDQIRVYYIIFVLYVIFLDIKCQKTEEIETEMTAVTLAFREIQGGEVAALKAMAGKADITLNTEETIPVMRKDIGQEKETEGVVT